MPQQPHPDHGYSNTPPPGTPHEHPHIPPQPTEFTTTSEPPPIKLNRKPILIAAVAVAATLVVGTVYYAVWDRFIREDSGVAACKAMRDGKNVDGSPKDSGDDKMTEDQYREAREVFEDSRHDKIREHGTALMDIAWQISQIPDGQEFGALAFIGPMGTHVSGLQTACADQGVIVNLNSK
jgi:hypothetical protein